MEKRVCSIASKIVFKEESKAIVLGDAMNGTLMMRRFGGQDWCYICAEAGLRLRSEARRCREGCV